MLDDVRLYTRGDTEVLTAPVVELGGAIITLISGELPEAPDGKIWLYGTATGRETLDTSGGSQSQVQPRKTLWERLFRKPKS